MISAFLLRRWWDLEPTNLQFKVQSFPSKIKQSDSLNAIKGCPFLSEMGSIPCGAKDHKKTKSFPKALARQNYIN